MATTTTGLTRPAPQSAGPVVGPPQRPKMQPVSWWAAAGALTLTLLVYQLSRWVLFHHVGDVPAGPTPVPLAMKIALQAMQWGALAGTCVTAYYFLWRPWRRERRMTFDGMLLIACWTVFLTSDPWGSILRPAFTLNSYLIDLGCPQCQNPLFVATNSQSHSVEPIVAGIGFYGAPLILGVLIANKIMTRIRHRHPHLSDVKLVLLMLPIMYLFDVIVEVPFLYAGMWSFTSVIPELTISAGHYYQYPLYEGVLMSLMWTAFATLRFFKNDKGQTIAERGVDQVKVPTRRRTVLRLLAVIGAVQMIVIVTYHLPFQAFALHGNEWPKDVLKRSYLTHGLCGPGTDNACGGRAYPISVGSAHIRVTPSGAVQRRGAVPNQNVPQSRPGR